MFPTPYRQPGADALYLSHMHENRAARKNSLRTKYPDGLKFQCQYGCTKCCAIPGVVYVGSWEAPPMAEFFGMDTETFMQTHLRPHWGDVYEINMPDDKPCKFLTETGCAIYQVRPLQCSTFPFWPDHLKNAQLWENLRGLCPGIGHGRRWPWDEVEQIVEAISFGPFL